MRLPLIAALGASVVLAACVTPASSPTTRLPARPGSSRPVVVVQAPPAPGSAADSAARADSLRAVAEREVAARVAAERAEAERAEQVRLSAERARVERAARERAAAERADSIRAAQRADSIRVAERAAARADSIRAAERATARADSIRLAERAAERAAAERTNAQRAAADRAAAEREARRVLDSLRAAERETARRLDSIRVAERAVAERTGAERAAAQRQQDERAAAERVAEERRERAETPARAAERPAPAVERPAPAAARAAPRDPNVGIVDGPSHRLAGRHTFRFAGAPEGERVQWTVMRYTREPDGDENERRVERERGEELAIDLEGIVGGESRYLVTASAGPIADTAVVWAFPPNQLAAFTWRGEGHPDVRVWTMVPSMLSRSTRIVVVMHGDARDAVASAVPWEQWGAQTNKVILAPEFDAAHWPGERGYALGNLFASDEMTTLVPEPARAYAVVESMARGVAQGLGIRDPSFDMWGHGAGGEFVHRFLLFRPRAPVRIAVAANAGWYTMPDTTQPFPAGVKNAALDVDRTDLVAWTRRMLVVMRGTADTLRTGLPARAAAEAQGATRFARAAKAVEAAKQVEPRVAWWLLDVPGAGHDPMAMAPAAQMLLERMP